MAFRPIQYRSHYASFINSDDIMQGTEVLKYDLQLANKIESRHEIVNMLIDMGYDNNGILFRMSLEDCLTNAATFLSLFEAYLL